MLTLLLFIGVICAAFITGDNDFDIARKEVLLRRVGHELLLQSGDTTSRVLPVKKIAENEYQISFEREFAFEPGVLVKITQHVLASSPQTDDYVVNVLTCGNANVAYGFAISGNKRNDIVPCLGREQPRSCYKINIKFKPAGIHWVKNRMLLGSLPLMALIGFIYFRSVRPRRAVPDADSNLITLGALLFDAGNRRLTAEGADIDLTATESRLLLIFALSPNETIERSRLQKEIWEDEGVIVGRSLDMFISKLRRKLACDPGIRITVVRGKGYKLEIKL
ncbi:winged helix-turn-helix domain-containing protein [Pedobacter sp. SYP-B3415]|uniref:winged helix-turn-helix domain-containing protein n=1 Tax=Pedobacter sp. SYP-B3415 TaxID=2496641 RepID=UPI001F0D2FF8|nr:winged helix-turn-helix domain-containing protein [Pedobacter sp. SYP-B3415]